ncbi:MAG: hypothetical protein A2289_15950 [Deltaproteobacteria bacterium RIFOXYA12_FULL_58_15]|nr:MAG: hypothetical protein A2289_15950 [Deltaproteobacteria bacterium RIFOXYA12_FULL_58_15]
MFDLTGSGLVEQQFGPNKSLIQFPRWDSSKGVVILKKADGVMKKLVGLQEAISNEPGVAFLLSKQDGVHWYGSDRSPILVVCATNDCNQHPSCPLREHIV